MKNSTQKIDIIILEDNDFYRTALQKELKKTSQNFSPGDKFSFDFHVYSKAGDFLQDIRNEKFNDRNTIAFMDYYLGDGLNGGHILKILKGSNKRMKIILFSQSQNVIYSLRKKTDLNRDIDFIVKDQYTLAVCSLFLEQYIESKELLPVHI